MSLTYEEMTSHERSAKGGFVDAIGGIATIVLAILGLAGLAPTMMLGIATIVFGVALLIQGGTMLSEYARIIFPPGAKAASVDHFGGNSLSAVFLVGAAGIVLGLLALLGINHLLTSVAVIAFGTAMVLSSNSVWHLHVLKHAVARAESQSQLVGSEILASEMASDSAAIQALAGLAARARHYRSRRDGCNSPDPGRFARPTVVMSGSTLSGTVMSLMRPSTRTY
jgi:hypothetical protein